MLLEGSLKAIDLVVKNTNIISVISKKDIFVGLVTNMARL